MDSAIIASIFYTHLQQMPQEAERCQVGIGNYVYIVKCADTKYVFRCSTDEGAYKDTIYLLGKLAVLDIPIPKVLFTGRYEKYEYIILNYIEGKDIGLVYRELSSAEKKTIAKEVVEIQRKVSEVILEDDIKDWSWMQFVDEILERAEELISKKRIL